jgi:hypothetical protein
MPNNLYQIYTQHLIEAIIHENLPLIKKMIDHGAEIMTNKVDNADAIYIALDLNHLETLDYMLSYYTEKYSFSDYKQLTSFVFEDYFDVIFKNDNVKALSILDKHGMLDLVSRFRYEEYSMKKMMQLGATQCIMYSYDRLGEHEFTKELSEKIRSDLSVVEYEYKLMNQKEHKEFILSLKELNPEGFQIALTHALFSMKNNTYLERSDKPSYLHLITNYFEAGLIPKQEMKDIQIPNITIDKIEQISNNQYQKFYKYFLKLKEESLKTMPNCTFMDFIKYDETKQALEIAIEKHFLDNSLNKSIEKTEKILKI